MINCNPSQTQVDTESKLGPEDVPVQDPTLYHSLVGGLSISRLLDRICPTRYSMYASIRDNLLSWLSKRQHTLSRSSAKAEYRGVANVVAETAWLRNMLHELHSPLSSATLVYCDKH
ncbi:ribonuclease H-like domain-containing protein [Tanacetum coccineum]